MHFLAHSIDKASKLVYNAPTIRVSAKKGEILMTLALVLVLVGVGIMFFAFLYAAKNMATMGGGNFDSLWGDHIAAMVVMAFGGFLSTIGVIVGIYNLVT